MDIAPELTERFKTDLAQLWPSIANVDAKLGLAVSGGGDSLALLLLANAALPGRVEAATVDHQLRPESAHEALQVAEFCRSIGVPHQTFEVLVEQGNLQDRARAARYEALAKWCENRGLGALVTAHQMDDQAETLLMRLNRGSGLAGLASIRASGAVPGSAVLLLRPLLSWRRAELAHLVERAGWKAVSDPSNEDLAFDRIRIRKQLEGADWLDVENIARSARLLAEANDFVEEELSACWNANVDVRDGKLRYYPGKSRFMNIEMLKQIFTRMGAVGSRTELARLADRLWAGENGSLGGVLAKPARDDRGPGFEGRCWNFAPEPARRTN